MFNREPALILAAIQAAVIVAVVFGVDITDEQQEALLAFAGAILSLATGLAIRSQVTPVRP
jgi:hypothetical protein